MWTVLPSDHFILWSALFLRTHPLVSLLSQLFLTNNAVTTAINVTTAIIVTSATIVTAVPTVTYITTVAAFTANWQWLLWNTCKGRVFTDRQTYNFYSCSGQLKVGVDIISHVTRLHKCLETFYLFFSHIEDLNLSFIFKHLLFLFYCVFLKLFGRRYSRYSQWYHCCC